MTIYQDVIEYLHTASLAYSERFIPYFICSIGCHLINLENEKREIYYEQRKKPDLRLPVIMVAPPGFGKSTFLKMLLKEPYGVFAKSGLKTTFEGYLTEAGWVGTKRMGKGGSVEEVKGLAEEMSDGIVGMEEFSAVTRAMKQEHSIGLDQAVLQTLDGGDVYKRLAAGPIAYHTAITLLAGSVMPNTPVYIRRDGLLDVIPIQEIPPLCDIWTRNGWKKNLGLYTHGWSGEVLRLNTHGSYVEITPNHSLFTEDGREFLAGLLEKGNKIEQQSKITSYTNGELIPRELAYVQGLWCADGWINEDGAWSFRHPEKKSLEKARDILESYFPNSTSGLTWCNYGPKNSRLYYLNFKKPNYFLHQCLTAPWGSKKVPLNVLNSNREVQLEFLRGFWVGYGTTRGSDEFYRFTQKVGRLPLVLVGGLSILHPNDLTTRLDTHKMNSRCMEVTGRISERDKLMPLNTVKRIERFNYNGPVYDVETEDGTFACGAPNMIIAHNTQSGRFDQTSGLARRLFFIIWNPTEEEMFNLREAYWKGANIRPDQVRLTKIRDGVRAATNRLKLVTSIEYGDDLKDELFSHNLMFYELPLFKRLALGYHIMATDFGTEIKVNIINEEMRELIRQAAEWRRQLMCDLRLSQIEEFVRNKGPVTFKGVFIHVGKLGVVESEAANLIAQLVKEGRVTLDRGRTLRI